MKISELGIEALAKWEGNKMIDDVHYPYDDTNGQFIEEWNKHATIGYGHLIKNNTEFKKFINGITDEEAVHIFRNDVNSFAEEVDSLITSEIDQHQFDACVIFAYNIGKTGFSNSSAIKLINNPNAVTNYSSLETAWKAWNKQTIDGRKQIVNGLINRREKEWKLFEDGSYS